MKLSKAETKLHQQALVTAEHYPTIPENLTDVSPWVKNGAPAPVLN